MTYSEINMSTKKDQLKTLFKPIIKECIKELILEQGVLSTMISEINKANNKAPQQKQQVAEVFEKEQSMAAKKVKIDEARRKVYAALGSDSYSNIFENVEPLSANEAGASAPSHSPLSGRDPDDSGVDISSIPGMKMWKTLAEDKKR